MALESTTTELISPAGKDPQLESSADASQTPTVADQGTEDTSQASEPVQTAPDSEQVSPEDNADDTELKEWAAKKNLPLDDPLKLAKMYRDAEKELGKKGSQEAQLKTAVTDANSEAGVDDVQALRNEVAALSFYLAHPDAQQFEPAMVQILEEKPWLANDLEAVLDMAKGRSLSTAEQVVAAKQTGAKEALAAAAQASRAAPPKVSATQSGYEGNRITAENVDAQIAAHMGDAKWYNDHRAEIDAALSA